MISTPSGRIDWNKAKERLRAASAALDQSSIVDDCSARAIFRSRAAQLAALDPALKPEDDTSSLLVFRVRDERFGVEARHIAKVFPGVPITPVPAASSWLLGLANLDGEVRSVLRLDGRRDMPEKPNAGLAGSGYVLLLGRGPVRVGLHVERLEGIRRVDLKGLIEHVDAGPVEHVMGITDDKIIVLRTERFIANSQ